jgi:hypothetical protein
MHPLDRRQKIRLALHDPQLALGRVLPPLVVEHQDRREVHHHQALGVEPRGGDRLRPGLPGADLPGLERPELAARASNSGSTAWKPDSYQGRGEPFARWP